MEILKTKKQNKGITLIALMVTIIILLILAGITIAQLTENGLLEKVKQAKEKNINSQLKEEIEMAIKEIQIEEIPKGNDVTLQSLADGQLVTKLSDITSEFITNEIIGEYKNYEYTVDSKFNVKIGNKVVGVKPTGMAKILTTEELVEKVEIQVTASTTDGDIEKIEAINGAIEKEGYTESDIEKIFEVTKNGIYYFRIKGTNGSTIIIKTEEIKNICSLNDGILQEISKIRNNGIQTLEMTDKKNEGNIEKKTYSLDVILYTGDLVLDGEKEVEGATLANKIYEFGSKDDVATENEYAKNTVVLKVEGNLTINSGVTLTSVRSDDGYGGPKGIIIYVTGTLKNNGTISMTERGAKAEGENVYLFKNSSGSYEYIPYSGADGGSVTGSYATGIYGWTGNTGKAATGRETGGGRFRRSLDCWMEHDCFWKRCKWYFIFWRNRRRTEVLMELKDMMEMTLVELVVQEMVLQ